MTADYNTMELMISVAAHYLEDGKTVAVGTGAPCAAAMLAQKTCSPGLVVIFEAGGVAPLLPEMPISVGDSRTFYRAVMAAGMVDAMTTCARGQVDYAFLGAPRSTSTATSTRPASATTTSLRCASRAAAARTTSPRCAGVP